MIKKDSKIIYFSSMGFLPALASGLRDALSPGTMVAWILLVFFVIYSVKTGRRFVLLSLIFIAGVGMMRLVSILGYFDVVLNQKGFDIFLDVTYFLFMLFFLATGCIFFRDWLLSKQEDRDKDFIVKIDFPDQLERGQRCNDGGGFFRKLIKWACNCKTTEGLVLLKSFGRNIGLALCAFVSGAFVSFISLAWPPDYYIYFLFYYTKLPGKEVFMGQSFLLYALAFVLPLLLVLFCMSFLVRSQKFMLAVKQSVSKVQIILSAIFFGYGIAFLFFYIK